jgi:regulator of sigma D
MNDAFDYVKSINQTKKNMMRDTENDDLAERAYQPFLTNRSLSYFIDTVLLANEMNMRYDADNKLQYEYFLNSVRPRKRFAKWVKNNTDNDLEIIMEYHDCSLQKAREYARVLSDDALSVMKEKLEKGGT